MTREVSDRELTILKQISADRVPDKSKSDDLFKAAYNIYAGSYQSGFYPGQGRAGYRLHLVNPESGEMESLDLETGPDRPAHTVVGKNKKLSVEDSELKDKHVLIVIDQLRDGGARARVVNLTSAGGLRSLVFWLDNQFTTTTPFIIRVGNSVLMGFPGHWSGYDSDPEPESGIVSVGWGFTSSAFSDTSGMLAITPDGGTPGTLLIRLKKGALIGRSRHCHINTSSFSMSRTVSRIHAYLYPCDTGYWILDLDSLSGISGVKGGCHLLKRGSRAAIGNFVLRGPV